MASKGRRKQKPTGPKFPDIAILTPPWKTGTLHYETYYDMIAIAQRGLHKMWVKVPQHRTDVVRNKGAELFLESDCSHLLMLDLDHRHPADIVRLLGRHAQHRPHIKIVAGLAYRRAEPYEPMAFWKADEKSGEMLSMVDPPENAIVEVEYVATCSMLIAREVFETVPWPWFHYDYNVETRASRSEDMLFCERARAAGFGIWVDTTFSSPHLTERWIGAEDYKAHMATTPRSAMSSEEIGILSSPGTVLYVGARPGGTAWIPELVAAGAEVDLLEIHPPNAEAFADDDRLAHVILGDVRNVNGELPREHYDYALWWHGPEHLEVGELEQALGNLEQIADTVVIGCPYGRYEQGELGGNPNEVHRTHWQPDAFTQLGYQVRTFGEQNEPTSHIVAWRHGGEHARS